MLITDLSTTPDAEMPAGIETQYRLTHRTDAEVSIGIFTLSYFGMDDNNIFKSMRINKLIQVNFTTSKGITQHNYFGYSETNNRLYIISNINEKDMEMLSKIAHVEDYYAYKQKPHQTICLYHDHRVIDGPVYWVQGYDKQHRLSKPQMIKGTPDAVRGIMWRYLEDEYRIEKMSSTTVPDSKFNVCDYLSQNELALKCILG